MPPEPFEYQGVEAIGAFLSHAFAARWQERHRLIPTRANGQPAFGHYIPDPNAGIVRGVGVLVLTLEGDRIAQITRFGGAALLAQFGLPRTLPA
jgi:RNA polymerase sigma-70 factor (ECF subfamily)